MFLSVNEAAFCMLRPSGKKMPSSAQEKKRRRRKIKIMLMFFPLFCFSCTDLKKKVFVWSFCFGTKKKKKIPQPVLEKADLTKKKYLFRVDCFLDSIEIFFFFLFIPRQTRMTAE